MHNHNILRALNVLSILIQTSYELGYEAGKFYRQHLHTHTVKLIALVITIAVHLWANKHRLRKRIEGLFVYKYEVQSPPIVNPLFNEMNMMLSLTSRQLRQLTGIRSKHSKIKTASLYLAMI